MDEMYISDAKVSKNENSPEITLESFAEAVLQMRYNQRRYFRYRRPEILERCKELERQVDEMVAQITDKQLNLWK